MLKLFALGYGSVLQAGFVPEGSFGFIDTEEHRVIVQEGDFQREGLGAGYDVALVFGVLNGEPPAGRPALIHKVYECLNPGGRIVLRDFVLDDDRAGPPEAALFALQMLLATEAGGLDTRDDWARWLTAAGFAAPQIIALPDWIGGTLTTAEKRPCTNLHQSRQRVQQIGLRDRLA